MDAIRPAFALDSTVEFTLSTGEDGVLRLAGSYLLEAKSLLVLGIPFDQSDVQPEGFNRSDGGFYFKYLPGTGKTERFEYELRWPKGRDVKCFLKRWYTDSEICFQIDGKSFSDYVFVQGSCVSRDLFEFDKLSLAGYRARSSFASISSPPIPYAESDLKQNPSDFQRRMVQGDLEKTDSKLATSAPGNIVMIDLIDERLPVYKCDSGIYTLSPEFQQTAIKLGGETVDPYSEQYFDLFESGWANFAAQINNKIILVNRVYWATHSEDGTELPDQSTIEKQNQKLERLYATIQKTSPTAHSLDYKPSDFVAATDHKWGRSPFHYAHSFNSLSADKLRDFVAHVSH